MDRFTKLIVKTRTEEYFTLKQRGFAKEAEVPNYFHGNNLGFYHLAENTRDFSHLVESASIEAKF